MGRYCKYMRGRKGGGGRFHVDLRGRVLLSRRWRENLILFGCKWEREEDNVYMLEEQGGIVYMLKEGWVEEEGYVAVTGREKKMVCSYEGEILSFVNGKGRKITCWC